MRRPHVYERIAPRRKHPSLMAYEAGIWAARRGDQRSAPPLGDDPDLQVHWYRGFDTEMQIKRR